MEMKMDYGPAERWVKEQQTSWSALARIAGVKPPALSARKTKGGAFPSTWIVSWVRHFRLTPEETLDLFLAPVLSDAERAIDEKTRQREALVRKALEQGGEFTHFMARNHPEILNHFMAKWVDEEMSDK